MSPFPALTPSSRVLTLGDYSHAPLQSMGGSQSQVRHSNVVVDGGLQMDFLGLVEADMLLIRDHVIDRRGRFLAFNLPADIWISTTDPTPAGYTWRYTEAPKVKDIGNGLYDVSVVLELMPPDPSGSIANTQDVVILTQVGIVRTSVSAPDVSSDGAASPDGIPVPAATITVSALSPVIEGDDPVAPVSLRRDASTATINLANGATGTTTITLPRSCTLFSIETDRAARVILYSSAAAASNDAGRAWATVPPTAGSGVIAQVTLAAAGTQQLEPAPSAINRESTPSNSYTIRVTNNGTTGDVVVTMAYTILED